MIKKIIFFILSFLIECEAAVKQQALSILKSEISQKITAADFNVSLSNWIDAWGQSSEPEARVCIEDIMLSDNNRNFSALLKLGTAPAKKLTGHVELLMDIPALKTPVGPGTVINEEHITWIRFPADKLSPQTITVKEALIGKTPRHQMLKMSSPLSSADLQNPVLIKKGDRVDVCYKSSTLFITAQAIAKNDGCQNDVISFEPLTSDGNKNKTIQAKVVGLRLAEIQHGA